MYEIFYKIKLERQHILVYAALVEKNLDEVLVYTRREMVCGRQTSARSMEVMTKV